MRALVFGSFDVLHHGHIEFLKMCERLGDVVVGLGTDEYQRGYKHDPVLSYEERRRALEALGYQVVKRDHVSTLPLLDQVKPDYIVAGSDWLRAPHLEMSGLTVADLDERGVAFVYMPRNHNMSTSEIVRRIREGVI